MSGKEKYHAKEIINLLLSRPEKKDDEGFYDFTADKKQMINLVEEYLIKNKDEL